jgi:threonine dehydratase
MVFGAEPAGADDAARSLAAGTIIRDASPRTICDGLRSCLGPLTFAVIVRRVDGIAVVDDADTLRAMQAVWENLEVVVEPSAAVALAAVLAHRLPAGVVQPGSKIGIVLTGGNVDLDRLPWT